MNSLLKRMSDGFDNFFKKFNAIDNVELIQQLEELNIITDKDEFDKGLFLSLCQKYNVELSKVVTSPMIRHDGKISKIET